MQPLERFAGVLTAMVTPLRNDQVDEAALRALISTQIEAGIAGLVPCGTTGEAATLTPSEWEQVVGLTCAEAAGRIPVVAGVGSNDTRATIETARRAEALGTDAVLVVTPYYNKPTQEGLYRHFCAVADAVSIQVCLYNVPGRTGVHLEAETVARLARVGNITAIKEATGSLTVLSELQLKLDATFALLSGDDLTTLPFVAQGGHGVISVASNLVPGELVALVRAAIAGERARARDLHLRLYPLFQVLFAESNPIPIKTALALVGRMSEERRLPLCEPRADTRTRLMDVLRGLELLGRSR